MATAANENVEYPLRADDALTEAQVRQIMEYYLAVRMRRLGRVFQPADPTVHGNGHGRSEPPQRPMGFRPSQPAGAAPKVGIPTRVQGTSTMTRPTGRGPDRY